MRGAVVLALIAVIGGFADAAPKRKKRGGPFAAYIDPAAPADPPRPKQPKRAAERKSAAPELAVLFVVDQTVASVDDVKRLVTRACDGLAPNDMVAVIGFTNQAAVYVRPTRASNHFRITSDVSRMQRSTGGNLYPGLRDAHQLANGMVTEGVPIPKVIVLITDGATPRDGIDELLDDMSSANQKIVAVGVPGADRLFLARIADRTRGKLVMLEDPEGSRPLFDALRAMHKR